MCVERGHGKTVVMQVDLIGLIVAVLRFRCFTPIALGPSCKVVLVAPTRSYGENGSDITIPPYKVICCLIKSNYLIWSYFLIRPIISPNSCCLITYCISSHRVVVGDHAAVAVALH